MARHEVQIMLEVQVLFQGESGVRKAHGLVLGAQVSACQNEGGAWSETM